MSSQYCPNCGGMHEPTTGGCYYRYVPGWICPRCGKVNGPHVNECSCSHTPASPWATTTTWTITTNG